MNRATRLAAQATLDEVLHVVDSIPTSPVERAEIRAYVGIRMLTAGQRQAVTYALADQARSIERDRQAYFEHVADGLGTEIGRQQLLDGGGI